MEKNKFEKGFVKGDVILELQRSPDRYLEVTNNGKNFIVADNGERRQVIYSKGDMKFLPPLNKSALKGELPFSDINKVAE